MLTTNVLFFLLISITITRPFKDPCSLNGDFINGKCKCDPGWKGTNCTLLKLSAASRSTPGYYNTSLNTWSGGNIYYSNNQYHLFVGAKAIENTSDDLYLCNSNIIHLVSNKSINGPFHYKNTILSRMNLNPFTIYFNGTYIIFDEGYNNLPPIEPMDECQVNSNSNDETYNSSYITTHLTYSSDINAPLQEWMNNQYIIIDPFPGTTNRSQWDCNIQNPTAYIFPNGTTIMMYRGAQCATNTVTASGEHIGIAIAPHWKGPYKRLNNEQPIFGWNAHNEDPFLWRNKRGFHLLMHTFDESNYNQSNGQNSGSYAYSIDGISWILTDDNPWISYTEWTDGTNTTWIRRQKPSLIFDNETNPIYLMNGVDAEGNNGLGYRWGTGWTLIQPISP